MEEKKVLFQCPSCKKVLPYTESQVHPFMTTENGRSYEGECTNCHFPFRLYPYKQRYAYDNEANIVIDIDITRKKEVVQNEPSPVRSSERFREDRTRKETIIIEAETRRVGNKGTKEVRIFSEDDTNISDI
jgi:hypothetical protein